MNQSKYILSAAAVLILVLAFLYFWRTPSDLAPTTTPPPVVVSEPSYSSSTLGFSVTYPKGYLVDEQFRYQALGPGRDIQGVKFTIPATMATGTNLSTDTYLSVERIIGAKECSAALFLGEGVPIHVLVDNATSYSVASSSDAAAGNRYEETVYALPGDPCIAVRYLIHYGAIENYLEGMVRAFDRAAIVRAFDTIRRSLVVTSPIGRVNARGVVTLVDTKQSETDGPILVTVADANGVVSIIAVPARGLGLCAAKETIADAFTVEKGNNVEVSGSSDTKGRIVPCTAAEDYFRVLAK